MLTNSTLIYQILSFYMFVLYNAKWGAPKCSEIGKALQNLCCHSNRTQFNLFIVLDISQKKYALIAEFYKKNIFIFFRVFLHRGTKVIHLEFLSPSENFSLFIVVTLISQGSIHQLLNRVLTTCIGFDLQFELMSVYGYH